MSISLWTVCAPVVTDEFWVRYAAEQAEQDYTGPMDDQSYALLSTMGDIANTQPLYAKKDIGGDLYTLFAMNLPDEQSTTAAVDYLQATWPGDIEVEGAWDRAGTPVDVDGNIVVGLQVGVEPGEVDTETGTRVGPPTGQPIYPIPADAYKVMPDVIEYDEDGNPISVIPPTSNDDLRDINLIYGQAPRQFRDPVTAQVIVIDPVGEQGDPAVIKFLGQWTPDASIQFSATLSNDDTSSVSFKPVGPLTPQQIANIVAALLDARPELIAQNTNDTVRVRPTDNALTLTVRAYVGYP